MSDDDSRHSADLGSRLRALRKRVRDDRDEEPDAKPASMGAGAEIAADFVAGIVVGALFGYGLDWWFGTSPWLLVILMLFGFAAGVRSAYRVAKRASESDQSR
jgi:ATP synthase protein I